MEKYYKKTNASPEEKGKTTLVGKDGKVNVPEFAKASRPYKNKSSYK